LEKEWWHARSS